MVNRRTVDKGYIQLALRSGQYKCLNADCIYEGEEIKFNRLSGRLSISGEKTSDTVVGYFAYFELINGFEKTLYMTVDEIRAYGKKYSKAFNNGPWQTDFDAMAKKTVIRQILKFGPMSTEMQEAERDEVKAAEDAARAEAAANANAGGVVDIPTTYVIDGDTGEVTDTVTPADDGGAPFDDDALPEF